MNDRRHAASHPKQPTASKRPGPLITPAVDPLAMQQAVLDPLAASPSDVLALQHAYGNRAVQRLIQAKLSVGPAGDKYEQEADRVADQVMRLSVPATSTQTPHRKDEDEAVQLKSLIQPVRGAGGFEVNSAIEGRLAQRKGGGAPLSNDVQAFMESRFSADFSPVRIHADQEAAQLSRDLQAQAFTHGTDIYLGEGKYSPGTSAGKRLLAHELTHTIQQNGVRLQRQPTVDKTPIAPKFEHEATPAFSISVTKDSVVQLFTDDDVRNRAYHIWQKKGSPQQDKTAMDQDWAQAKSELEQEEAAGPAATALPAPTPPAPASTVPTSTAPTPTALKSPVRKPPAPLGARTPAAGPGAPSPAPEDWSSLNGQQLLAKINMRNCSWAALAHVLGKSEKVLTEKWQREQGVLEPQEHLRTERAWATAMVGLDRLKAGAAAGPTEFTKVVANLEMRIDEKKGGYDVAQSYGLQKMILDAVVASGGKLESGGASASAAYRFGDAGTDQFKTKAEILTAMNAFPVGTRFVVFLHGRAAGGAGEGGHYVAADHTPGGIEFVDKQFAEGTTTPRGKMELEGGWPKVHKDFKYVSWVDGAFLALAPQALAGPMPGLEPITPMAVDRYRTQNVQTKVPRPPGWLASLTAGDELYQHSASQKSATGEGRVKVTASSDGKLFDYRADKGGWVVYVKPEVTRNAPATAPTGPVKTVALEGIAAGGAAAMKAAIASKMGSGGGATAPKLEKVAVSGVIPVPAADLMLKADVGKVTHTPPQWYGQVVADVSAQIAQDLQKSKAELTKQNHRFPGPNNHVYDDGTVIAMASGITRMLEYLGIGAGKPVIVPELGKTMFVLPQDSFAYLQSLFTPNANKNRPYNRLDEALAADPALLKQQAINDFIAAQALNMVTATEEEANKAIIDTYGRNPGRTGEGKVIFNEAMMGNIAQDPHDDAKAFVHVVIHEFMHANSEGGGGSAIAGHDSLNQQHEEGVTDIIARAISDAINTARNVDDPTDAAVRPAVQKAVTEIKAVTFGSNGGVRYQSEVDLVIARISDVDMLRNVVARAYFTPQAKADVAKMLG